VAEVDIPHPERNRVLEAVGDLLAENGRIPKTSFCTHPAAQFTIPTGEAAPSAHRQYPLPHALHDDVTRQVEEWLEAGTIARGGADSPWQSPLLAVPKYNASTGERAGTRVCLDVRRVNEAVVDTETRPIPRAEDVFRRLEGMSVFSTIDLSAGYNQIPVAPDSRPKTRFM
jgi:hypothetical protein